MPCGVGTDRAAGQSWTRTAPGPRPVPAGPAPWGPASLRDQTRSAGARLVRRDRALYATGQTIWDRAPELSLCAAESTAHRYGLREGGTGITRTLSRVGRRD